MSRNLPIALVVGLILSTVAGLLASAQEPKDERVPPAPKAVEVPAKVRIQTRPMIKAVPVPAAVPVIPATPPPPPAPPTEATRVALDFPAQPIAGVIRTLAGRTGGMVDTFNTNDARWTEPVTLSSPDPVPFWEAMDRLRAAANIVWTVTQAGPFSNPPPRVQFSANFARVPVSASAADEGLVAYVGPFRAGPVTVHEHFRKVFRKPVAPVIGLSSDPPAPFYAEVALLVEPNLLAVQTGPLRRVEAVDGAGRSLLDPKLGGEVPYDRLPHDIQGPPSLLRVPMVRGEGTGGTLKTLRLALPLEVGRRPVEPTQVIALAGSVGKTFRDGDLAFTIREYRADPQGPAMLSFTARIEGKRGEAGSGPVGVVDARLWTVFHRQIELVDAQGKPINGIGGGSHIDGEGVRELSMRYSFGPASNTPTHVRIYRPEWVAWELPVAFHEVPLP